MSKGEKLFTAVAEARAKDPNTTIQSVADKLGINPNVYSYYVNSRKAAQAKKPTALAATKVAYQRIPASEPTARQAPMALIIGTPDQLRDFAKGLYA